MQSLTNSASAAQGLWLELKCFLTAEACGDAETACHTAALLETCESHLAQVAQDLAVNR